MTISLKIVDLGQHLVTVLLLTVTKIGSLGHCFAPDCDLKGHLLVTVLLLTVTKMSPFGYSFAHDRDQKVTLFVTVFSLDRD